jgi:hypothetical protein
VEFVQTEQSDDAESKKRQAVLDDFCRVVGVVLKRHPQKNHREERQECRVHPRVSCPFEIAPLLFQKEFKSERYKKNVERYVLRLAVWKNAQNDSQQRADKVHYV